MQEEGKPPLVVYGNSEDLNQPVRARRLVCVFVALLLKLT